MTRITAASTV